MAKYITMLYMKNVISPCIDKCYTDGYKCPGCGRTNDEVQEWFYAEEPRRKEILEECVKRLDPVAFDIWQENYEWKCQDEK